MDVDLVFKIAAIGILVSVLNQVLTRSGREEQATMATPGRAHRGPHDGGAEDQRALRAGQDPLRAVMGHGYAGFGRGGVVAALFAVMVRQRAPEMALVLAMAACVLLLWNTLPLLESIRDVMEELASLTEISPTLLRPMLQTVGLAPW